MTKICNICNEVKPLLDFYKSDLDRYNYRCKSCKNKINIDNRKTNSKKVKYYDRTSTINKRGIDRDTYDFLYKSQDKRCAICLREFKVLHIDHCHKTNKVRGLLCSKCNIGLGQFDDDADILNAAIEYLKKSTS